MENPNAEDLFINPYYAINISPSLIGDHEPLTTKEQWIKVNAKLMDEIGKEEWLKRLLDILESGEPRDHVKKRSI